MIRAIKKMIAANKGKSRLAVERWKSETLA